ncbi:MAG: HAD-IC family P-type ATPase, partial [Promicromonosporaceae bacterium]|nr:HAD-IC family P-type ATPase [Promicromonosporaceae bacterium]
MTDDDGPAPWYDVDVWAVAERLDVNPERGLTTAEVKRRQAQFGQNVLQPAKKISLPRKILHQLTDVSIIILLIAVALSFVLAYFHRDGYIEPFVILAVVVVNVVLAIVQEGKAERALEALEKLNSPIAIVLRDGARQSIDTRDVVPGDIVLLETGDIVPADARLIEAIGLFSDEAALTGESEPVAKDASLVFTGSLPLGDQQNMVFTSCVITGGNGRAIVCDIGMDTQIGRIAEFLSEVKRGKTPLQKRLGSLSRIICWIAIISALSILAIGIGGGTPIGSIVMVAIALAVAAVPETLALIVNLTLVNGVQKMVRKNTLVRKLPAIETLGNISVICSDKTGTLTQNQMTAKSLWITGGEIHQVGNELTAPENHFLAFLTLAGNAVAEMGNSGERHFLGNATEVGILRLVEERSIDLDATMNRFPRIAEIPFSSERKKMTVVLRDSTRGGYLVLTKGALDQMPFKNKWTEELVRARKVHDEFAGNALRVIALAGKRVRDLPDVTAPEMVESDVDLIGLVGLIDPPRLDAAQAIAKAEGAGIRTVMITGDHAATATAIAQEMGILHHGQNVMTGAELAAMSDVELNDTIRNFPVFARVTPEDKIRIVRAWQANGEVVAMTGDGVNDAPALRAADVGIAMGDTGTEVAKDAADIVLTDDNFATIVEAVSEGRNVYHIVVKVVYFLLVCNLSEIIIMVTGQMMAWGLVMTPAMLLTINLLGDGIPG